jgi:hypothetical protein
MVKRLEQDPGRHGSGTNVMVDDPSGDWIAYEDYQLLETAFAALKTSLSASLSAYEGSDYFDLSHAVRHALLVAEGRCPMCYGNDADMPCAYPGEEQPGCLRDIRLAAPVRCYRCHTEYDRQPLNCAVPSCGGVVFEPLPQQQHPQPETQK